MGRGDYCVWLDWSVSFNEIIEMIFFKKKKFQVGALEDMRPTKEKTKDYRFEEIASVPVVDWVEKPQSDWKKFPIFEQSGSSCVANAVAKIIGIEQIPEEGKFINLSRRDIYSQRFNKPGEGMNALDVNNIAIKNGVSLEYFMPSEGLTEQQMNEAADRTPANKTIAKVFRMKNWFVLPYDMDAIASVVDKNHPVMVFMRFNYSEWDRQVPVITDQAFQLNHAVAIVDRTLYQGKKAFIIDESWGKNRGINGQRILTEEWFDLKNGRINWASYFEDLSNLDLIEKVEKPKYKFLKDLKVGMTDPDIIALQDCLKYEGLFIKTQVSTGYFGGITRKAVVDFQQKYVDDILKPEGLSEGTGFVGPATRKKLNELFS